MACLGRTDGALLYTSAWKQGRTHRQHHMASQAVPLSTAAYDPSKCHPALPVHRMAVVPCQNLASFFNTWLPSPGSDLTVGLTVKISTTVNSNKWPHLPLILILESATASGSASFITVRNKTRPGIPQPTSAPAHGRLHVTSCVWNNVVGVATEAVRFDSHDTCPVRPVGA